MNEPAPLDPSLQKARRREIVSPSGEKRVVILNGEGNMEQVIDQGETAAAAEENTPKLTPQDPLR